jgi:hypothetical protein
MPEVSRLRGTATACAGAGRWASAFCRTRTLWNRENALLDIISFVCQAIAACAPGAATQQRPSMFGIGIPHRKAHLAIGMRL